MGNQNHHVDRNAKCMLENHRLRNCLKNSGNALLKIRGSVLLLSLLLNLFFGRNLAWAGEEGVAVHGYADVLSGTSSDSTPETQRLRGLSLGNIDLVFAPQFQGKTRAFAEIVYEPTAATGEMKVDLERAQLGYAFGGLTAWAGRFQTPLGYWNTLSGHGGEEQLTILRPRFLDFSDRGGVMPVRTVGIWAHGAEHVGEAGKFIYDLFATNGARITGYDSTTSPATLGSLDDNLSKSDSSGLFGGALAFDFEQPGLSGLRLGVHAVGGTVRAYSSSTYAASSSTENVRTMLTGGYLFYDNESVRILGEFYNYLNADITDPLATVEHKSWAYLALVSYDFGKYVPYLMFEKSNLDFSDPYFFSQANSASYERTTVGIRYDYEQQGCVKIQRVETSQGAPSAQYFSAWMGQVAVRF